MIQIFIFVLICLVIYVLRREYKREDAIKQAQRKIQNAEEELSAVRLDNEGLGITAETELLRSENKKLSKEVAELKKDNS